MLLFQFVVLCMAVLGTTKATLEEDMLPSEDDATDAIFTPVESRIVPEEDGRALWAGGDAIRGIEDEFKWAAEDGRGGKILM